MREERFRRGDVVWALDPYHQDDPLGLFGRGRPWLVINEGTFPSENDFLGCALTTKSGPSHIVELAEADWTEGRTVRPSHLDPTTIMTVKRTWIEGRVGALADAKVLEAKRRVKSYL